VDTLPPRLARLPVAPDFAALHARRADSFAPRLLGLAFLDRPPARVGLLLPRTRAVHTFGMRFALDLVWLDADGRAVRVDRGVPPRRLAACRQAAAVLETPSG
jgi:uncharacterized membrane protein (UPF0127 family)